MGLWQKIINPFIHKHICVLPGLSQVEGGAKCSIFLAGSGMGECGVCLVLFVPYK